MIIDGKKIAEEIIAGLGQKLKGKKLGIVVGVEDPATESFVRIKTRVAERLGVEVIKGELVDLIKTCDGIIIQLPHPKAEELIATLPPEKDVDAVGKKPIVRAPVAGAIIEILNRSDLLEGNPDVKSGPRLKRRGKAVVVGKGRLVGAPAAELLKSLGAHVTVVTQTEHSLEELQDADIVVLGAGNPGMIGPDMIKLGVVLIDAGTSEAGGKLMGDAQPGCAHIASVFTPVPGGVGPIAVAMIFKNLLALAKKG